MWVKWSTTSISEVGFSPPPLKGGEKGVWMVKNTRNSHVHGDTDENVSESYVKWNTFTSDDRNRKGWAYMGLIFIIYPLKRGSFSENRNFWENFGFKHHKWIQNIILKVKWFPCSISRVISLPLPLRRGEKGWEVQKLQEIHISINKSKKTFVKFMWHELFLLLTMEIARLKRIGCWF